MELNWLDIVLIVILIITFILGIIKGLIRQVIGILAVIAGLIFAIIYYPIVSELYIRLVSHEALSHLLGFLTIFVVILCAGWLLSLLLSKMMKGPLKFINHVLGGGFGLLKGILICGVIVFALLVFPVDKKALKRSLLSPYCLKMTKAVYYFIPKDLKEKFSDAYRDIVSKGEKDAKRI